jgi:spore maturation protein CgeB
LPQACAPQTHCTLTIADEERERYGSDLSFMGAGYYNRKVFFEKFIDFDFKIWGSEWDLSSPVGRLVQKDGIRINEYECVKIYNAAKINLNLHSSSFHEGVNPVGDFVNPRTFEIAACGAFQLCDHRSELSELFEIGKEIICYKDIDELRSLVTYFLKNPAERTEIASRGQLRAKQDHTFGNRMMEMLSVIFEHKIDVLHDICTKGNQVDQLIEEAGEETELGKYLTKFKKRKIFSLKDIMEDIGKGEGSLTKAESIFLIINQFIKEKGEKIGSK